MVAQAFLNWEEKMASPLQSDATQGRVAEIIHTRESTAAFQESRAARPTRGQGCCLVEKIGTAACLVAKATPDISQARSAWIGAKG
jgi:hypothetical protein